MKKAQVIFNKRAAFFYRVQNHEPKACDYRPDKTSPASLLNDFKDISGRVSMELTTLTLL